MRRAHLSVFIHLIWSTWDRNPVLDGDLRRNVHRAIGAKCVELGLTPVAIGGVEDHVHLLVELPATITIADLVGQAKGASAPLVNYQLAPGSAFKWLGAYAAFSVSQRAVSRVTDYIARQPEHHANGSSIPELEPPFIDVGRPR